MDGGAVDGGAVDGGAVDGGAVDGGAVDGGAVDGGAVDGGAVDGEDEGVGVGTADREGDGARDGLDGLGEEDAGAPGARCGRVTDSRAPTRVIRREARPLARAVTVAEGVVT